MQPSRPSFLALASRPDIVARSLRVALIVGTLLALINHGNRILAMDLDPAALLKIRVIVSQRLMFNLANTAKSTISASCSWGRSRVRSIFPTRMAIASRRTSSIRR